MLFTPAINISTFSTETKRFLDRLITTPSVARQALYNTFITTLVSAGIWSKLDIMMLIGSDDATSCTNLISSDYPFARNFQTSTSNTFQPNLSFSSRNNNSAMLTHADLAKTQNYKYDSGMIGCWNLNANASSIVGSGFGPGLWTDTVSSLVRLSPSDAAGDIIIQSNSATTDSFANPGDTRGFYVVNRTSSTSFDLYRNAVNLNTFARNATPFAVTDPINFGAGPLQICAFCVGDQLTSGQITTLYNAISAYRTAILPVHTWNPFDMQINQIDLTNGNLTAKNNVFGIGVISGNPFQYCVRSNVAAPNSASGKYHVEFTQHKAAAGGANTTGLTACGMCSVHLEISNFLSNNFDQSTNGAASFRGGTFSDTINNIVTVISGAPFPVEGEVIAMEVDFLNKRIWFKSSVVGGDWNNIGGADPATNTGGIDITFWLTDNADATANGRAPIFLFCAPQDPAVPGLTGYGITMNVGASAYAITPSAGFGNWVAA
jgi:hypothetical protein